MFELLRNFDFWPIVQQASVGILSVAFSNPKRMLFEAKESPLEDAPSIKVAATVKPLHKHYKMRSDPVPTDDCWEFRPGQSTHAMYLSGRTISYNGMDALPFSRGICAEDMGL